MFRRIENGETTVRDSSLAKFLIGLAFIIGIIIGVLIVLAH